MDKAKLSEFLEEMMDALTLRRLALLTLLASISIVMFSGYENRTALFATIYKTAETQSAIQWDLSNESREQMIDLSRLSLAGAVQITDVDLKKNRRVEKFFYSKDKTISDQINFDHDGKLPAALFDYDSKNTEQMVSMLNNEFRCVPSKDSSVARFLGPAIRDLPYVCRIAVPPFFGEFAGFITMFLVRQPSPEEFDSLRIEMNRVAIEIYLRDISKKAQSFPTSS